MAGERWREKLAEGKSLTIEDAKAIVTEMLGGFALMDKEGEDYIKLKEAGRDLVKLRGELDKAGGSDVLKWLSENKDNMELFEEALKKKKDGAPEPSADVVGLKASIEELQTTIKNMDEESKKKSDQFATDTLHQKTRTRIAEMLTDAAAEGIVIEDAFLKPCLTDEVVAEMAKAIEQSDTEFGTLLGEKVVKPAFTNQQEALTRLGVASTGVEGGESTVVIPGSTPGPEGTPFNRGIGRLGVQTQPTEAVSWAGMMGPDLINPQLQKKAEE